MSVKISQLPEFSGAPDGTYIVVNNSSETTTSKILREDFLTGVGGGIFTTTGETSAEGYTNWSTPTYINSITGKNLLINVDSLRMDDYFSGNTVIGTNHYLRSDASPSDGTQNAFIYGDSNFVRGNQTNPIVMGQNHQYDRGGVNFFIIGGSSNVLSSIGGNAGGILGGQSNTVYSSNYQNSVMIGGAGNSCQNNVENVGIFLGGGNTISSSNYNTVTVGGTSASVSSASHGVVAGGYANTLKEGNCMFVNGRNNIMWGNYQDCDGGIYSSWSSTSFTAGKATMMGAGFTNYLANGSHYSTLFGGEHNSMSSAESSFMGGNDYCTIDTVDKRIAMLASSGSTISGGTAGLNESAMIGSYNTVYHATGTQPASVVMLGLRDRNILLNNADRPFNPSGTTFVENHHVYRTLSRQTLTGITATGSVQVNLGNQTMMSFTITGNITDITFTNWREGGMYEFYVYNSGSYTITASGVRLDGIANTVYAKGGTLNPTNNGYTYYRMTIINSKAWLDEHLNFSAL